MPFIEPEWEQISRHCPVGTKVCGIVQAKFRYGIWVEIRSPVKIEGPCFLLEIMRISDVPSMGDLLAEKLNIGDTICAVVIFIDQEIGVRLSSRKSDYEKFGIEWRE